MTIGPRMYLVGRIAQGIMANPDFDASRIDKSFAKFVVTMADDIMEAMQWPNGKPESVSEPPSIGDDVGCKHEQIMGGICADCGTDFRGLA